MATLIPTRNGAALSGYYCGIFSLIPCLGLILGAAALILGIRGLKAYNANPSVQGRTHSWVAIILGGITFPVNLIFVGFLVAGAIAGSR